MKTPLPAALLLLAALLATSPALLAIERPTRSVPILPALVESGLAGLQISLTTSGYKFLFPATDAAPAARGVRESFVASALLANRSNSDVTFIFPTPAAAATKWTFRIFDSKGVLLWQSDRDIVAPQMLADATLEKRARWKRLVQVPLRIDGKLLAPGLYTLEASIDAEKSLSATALFEIAVAPVAP